MSLLSAFMQFLLPLCLTVIGIRTFPTEIEAGDNNTTEPWETISNSVITITPGAGSSKPSAPQLPEITRSRKTTPERILYITGRDDYYYYDEDEDDSEEVASVTPPHVPPVPCPYNRCKHLELPCEEIQMRAGGNCLCPGLSGRSFPPDSPRLGQIIPGERGVSVNWCSPLSTVQSYRVMYKTIDGPLEHGPVLNSTYRFYSLDNLLPDTSYRVCVVAFNEAGESPIEEADEEATWENGTPGPCMVFRTFSSQESHIYLGVGIGLAALAGVLVIIVLGYWLLRKKKVSRRKEGEWGEMGVTNMSFKAESVEQL
ncbi:LRRN4 C-terminal-like protein [Pelodytes ibericus]